MFEVVRPTRDLVHKASDFEVVRPTRDLVHKALDCLKYFRCQMDDSFTFASLVSHK
jgi:hypothetical protein